MRSLPVGQSRPAVSLKAVPEIRRKAAARAVLGRSDHTHGCRCSTRVPGG